MPSQDARTLHRVAAGVALLVGAGAAIAPRRLVALYGVDPDEMTGVGEFGWRLFAVRNLVVGGAALAGHRAAQDTVTLVQVPDQIVFWHALRSGAVPRTTGVLAIATSAAVAGLGLAARARS